MPQTGVRQRIRHASIAAAPCLLCLMCLGCTLFHSPNRAVVQVETRQNTAKANRLTYAGIRALNRGQIDLAARRFREAVQADHAYGPAHNNLGLMHYEQGNLYQAVLAFAEASELLPSDPTVVYNLALALESAGRTEEALELYYKAHEMDRANPHFLGNLVRLRVRMEEHDDALVHQLRDLVLIETRPQWRRWADEQLGLTTNLALDRGPTTPDLETAANDSTRRERTKAVRDKIIDLTPSSLASAADSATTNQSTDPKSQKSAPRSQPMMLEPPRPPAEPPENVHDGDEIDLSEEAYYR